MAAPATEVTSTDLNLVPLDALARFHGAARLPLATAMYLGANIARAVAEHHDRGHVLGTLDANRIRCSHQGQVVIGEDGGSFMAPEAKRGEPPDVLSDIYAVGAIIYRLLTGMTPLQAMTRQPVSRLHQVPTPSALVPGVDPILDEVLLAALATDPGERPISARIICQTIESIFAELELIASPSGVVRAVAATDSKRMRRFEPPIRRGEGRTETNSVVSTQISEVDAPTIDLDSIIVSPSLCQPAITESATVPTRPGSALVAPTRELTPPPPPPETPPMPTRSVVQTPTVLERPSRSLQGETPTQSYAPVPVRTSLIYGHPFFRHEDEGNEGMESRENYVRALKGKHFAGEVYDDARQRMSRKWSRASLGTRRWTIAAAVGACAVLVLSGMLMGRKTDATVEVSGEPDVSMRGRPAAQPVPVVARPVPVEVPRPTSVVLAPTQAPLAQPVVAAPSRPVAKVAAAPAKVTRGKLTKKAAKAALAAKKKAAAKRSALARRGHR